MTAVSATLLEFSFNPVDKFEGMSEAMSEARNHAIYQINKAASENSDEAEYLIMHQQALPENAEDVWNRCLQNFRKSLRLPLGALLTMAALIPVAALAGKDAGGMIFSLLFAIAMVCVVDIIIKFCMEAPSKKGLIKHLSSKSGIVWGVGKKAIYVSSTCVHPAVVQTVQLDAVGSVSINNYGNLEIASRFGDSKAFLDALVLEGKSLDGIVEDIRRRAAAARQN
jgi:hypothetical protein